MKKMVITLMLFLTSIFIQLDNVDANDGENAGSAGGDNSHYADTEGTDYKWSWNSNYNGLKITVYKKDGTVVGTKSFLNNMSEVKKLNSQNVTVRKSGSLRLTNIIDKGSWGYADSNYFQYLDFDDFLQTTTQTNIISFLKAQDDEELIKKLGVDHYSGTEKNDLVLVIEPATVFNNKASSISKKGLHFGTYWEFQYWKDNYKSKNEFGWVLKNVINKTLGENLKIQSTEISAQKTPEIWEFLSHFNSFKNNVTKKTSLGVAIVTLKDVIDKPGPEPSTIPKSCPTEVIKGSCTSNYSIEEPTDKDCVVNNSKYQYKTIGDCGVIYCSESVSTDLDNFYDTFVPIIESGRYFKMNSVKVDITKTCYLKKYSNNSCPNWQSSVTANQAGTIKLSLVSDYTLVKDDGRSNFNVQCKSTANGECTKVVATQHIEYVLEPNTNRYISIEDMAGTATSSGDNIVDLGGEHLTTPIGLSTGKHNYTVDYSGSILSNYRNRLTNDTITIKLDNYTNLKLLYSYDQQLTAEDLKYSCEYTTTRGDEICPPNECCEGSKIVPCPELCVCDSITGCDEECNPNPVDCICPGECCDNECNVIDCGNPEDTPGGYPNLVYRPINLQEPFPGQDGIGRDFGSNWHGNVYDTNGNTINKPNGTPYTKVEYYIDTNRGHSDYDVYHSKPLYIIKLDYDALSAIREYNELTKHNYNDFSLTCVNGQNCISNFLRGNLPNFNINLITSGECADSTTTNFSECTKRLGA